MKWMAVKFCIGILGFSLIAGVSYASEIGLSGESEAEISDTETNSIKIRCPHSKPGYYNFSRGAVLASGPSDYDILLTTGHGVTNGQGEPTDGCAIHIGHGQYIPVITQHVAQDYALGTPQDWALMVVPRLQIPGLNKYYLIADLEGPQMNGPDIERLDVRFSQSRAITANLQTCQTWPRDVAGFDEARFDGFMAHDCDAGAGQSGTPISRLTEQGWAIVGIHVGNSKALRIPETEHSGRYFGYMRLIDEDLRRDIETVSEQIVLSSDTNLED